MKKISSTNPRRWGIEDFESDRGGYRRALPVIVLDKWEREGGTPGADCLTLEEISNELLASGAITEPMSGRAWGAWMGAFVRKQRELNLTPVFLEQIDPGVWRFNVRDYESLLRKFRELYPLTGKSEEARRMELPLKELHRWTVEDLESRKQLMRALPVIALEKWESEGGAPGADHLTIKEINKELLARGVISKPISGTGVGALVYGLVQRQEKRKLNPLLVERVERGVWRFNISYYETVLREFRDRYPLRRTGTISSQPRQQEPTKQRVDAQPQRTRNASSAMSTVGLRGYLSKITNLDTREFVEEAIRCIEADLYRASVVICWIGAVSVLYDYVLTNKLVEFNSEATRRDPKWKPATTRDDLALMKESDFLDILAAISVLGKNVKEHLKNTCLNLRNSCGHPSSLKLGRHTVEAHLETLILNVYSRF